MGRRYSYLVVVSVLLTTTLVADSVASASPSTTREISDAVDLQVGQQLLGVSWMPMPFRHGDRLLLGFLVHSAYPVWQRQLRFFLHERGDLYRVVDREAMTISEPVPFVPDIRYEPLLMGDGTIDYVELSDASHVRLGAIEYIVVHDATTGEQVYALDVAGTDALREAKRRTRLNPVLTLRGANVPSKDLEPEAQAALDRLVHLYLTASRQPTAADRRDAQLYWRWFDSRGLKQAWHIYWALSGDFYGWVHRLAHEEPQ